LTLNWPIYNSESNLDLLELKKLSNFFDFVFKQTSVLFREVSMVSGSNHGLDDKEVAAIGAVCAFLHVAFNTLSVDRMMTVLAFRTELVRVLWNFMKQCHENKKWPSLPEQLSYLPGDVPGWLLPLAVFCPVYKSASLSPFGGFISFLC
jgi:ubiquitin-protein ligase E3 C